MKILSITREQFEMMDSDPINTIKIIILVFIVIVCLYYLNSFYKKVKNALRIKAIKFFNIKY